MLERPRVLVVGSCNVDFVWNGPRLPERGETVSDGEFVTVFGGKGANQAIAAARLGAAVQLVTCVGTDDLGRAVLADLHSVGVDCTYVAQTPSVATGAALINVAADGANTIVVAPGANRHLDLAVIEQSITESDASVLLSGYEIGTDPAMHALAIARQHGIATVCNPSPSAPGASFADCDVVIVNEVEFADYGELQGMRERGAHEIVVTLGDQGAQRFAAGETEAESVAAFASDVVDTTGAGDAFCAAYAVTRDLDFGVAVGSLACRALGARGSLPSFDEAQQLVTARRASRP